MPVIDRIVYFACMPMAKIRKHSTDEHADKSDQCDEYVCKFFHNFALEHRRPLDAAVC